MTNDEARLTADYQDFTDIFSDALRYAFGPEGSGD